jgi:hypothetical protein
MGDWTLSSGSIVKPYRTVHGGPPNIRHFQCSTAVSTARITRGDVVHFDATDTAGFRIRRDLIASTTPSTAIIGIAAGSDTFSDAAGTGLSTNGQLNFVNVGIPNTIPVYLAQGTEFIGFSTGASPSTLLGTARVLSRDSTLNVWLIRNAGEIGMSTLADRRVLITEVPYPGDTNAPLVFRFLSQNPAPSSVSTAAGYLALGQV